MILLEFGPLVEVLLLDISYLELWQPSCCVEWNCLENFCEIILILDQWLWRRCDFYIFFI